MTRRRGQWAAGVTCVLAIGVAGAALGPLLIDEWYLRQLESKDQQAVEVAARRLAERQCWRAIPRLLDTLDQNGGLNALEQSFAFVGDAELQRATRVSTLLSSLDRLATSGGGATSHLIDALDRKQDWARAWALTKLVMLPKLPEGAFGPLCRRLRDPTAGLARAAARALSKFGRAAVPTLVEALGSAALGVRMAAVASLGDIGPPGKAAVPALEALLETEDRVQLEAVASSLSLIGWQDLPALIERLSVPSVVNRILIVETLSSHGKDALQGMEQLIGCLLQQESLYLRLAASRILARLGSPAVAPILAALERTKPTDRIPRFWCATTLGEMGPEAKTAVPALEALLDDADIEVRGEAKEALEKIRSSVAPAEAAQTTSIKLPDLAFVITALTSSDPDTIARATFDVSRLGHAAVPAVPVLRRLLGSSDPVVQASAAEALGRIGLAAQEARPAIESLLSSGEQFVRLHARRARDTLGR